MLSRRQSLLGLGTLFMPAIIRTPGLLMPIKPIRSFIAFADGPKRPWDLAKATATIAEVERRNREHYGLVWDPVTVRVTPATDIPHLLRF